MTDKIHQVHVAHTSGLRIAENSPPPFTKLLVCNIKQMLLIITQNLQKSQQRIFSSYKSCMTHVQIPLLRFADNDTILSPRTYLYKIPVCRKTLKYLKQAWLLWKWTFQLCYTLQSPAEIVSNLSGVLTFFQQNIILVTEVILVHLVRSYKSLEKELFWIQYLVNTDRGEKKILKFHLL